MGDHLHIDMLGANALRSVKETPQGGIEVQAYLTRTGIFTYYHPDGTKSRELRHPDEVFKPESLATIKHATVTIDHPPEREVTPANWRRVSVGHADDAKPVGNKVAANVVVQDSDAAARVKSKELCEISMGYRCDYDDRPGMWNGEPYDKRQINIRYNHVAIGPKGWGRAGRDVGIKLDSPYSTGMDIVHVDDAASTVEKPVPPQVLDASQFVAKSEHDKLQAKCDALEAQVKELTSAKNDALDKISPAKLDALVAQRAQLVDAAKALAGKDFKCDGLGEQEIRSKALVAADANVKLDGKSADYVTALFEIKSEQALKALASHAAVQAVTAPAPTQPAKTDAADAPSTGDKVADARAGMLKRNGTVGH